MAEIKHLDEEKRKVMKIKKKYAIEYTCKCGVDVVYESDIKVKSLRNGKCWKCKSKEEEKII